MVALWRCEEEEVKTQHQRRDVWSTKFKAKEHLNFATLLRFLQQNYKSMGDPIFEVLSDVRTRSGTRSRSDPRDRENSCFCISLLELSMIYRTMFVITFIIL